jgi:hypothetical protein
MRSHPNHALCMLLASPVCPGPRQSPLPLPAHGRHHAQPILHLFHRLLELFEVLREGWGRLESPGKGCARRAGRSAVWQQRDRHKSLVVNHMPDAGYLISIQIYHAAENNKYSYNVQAINLFVFISNHFRRFNITKWTYWNFSSVEWFCRRCGFTYTHSLQLSSSQHGHLRFFLLMF